MFSWNAGSDNDISDYCVLIILNEVYKYNLLNPWMADNFWGEEEGRNLVLLFRSGFNQKCFF